MTSLNRMFFLVAMGSSLAIACGKKDEDHRPWRGTGAEGGASGAQTGGALTGGTVSEDTGGTSSGATGGTSGGTGGSDTGGSGTTGGSMTGGAPNTGGVTQAGGTGGIVGTGGVTQAGGTGGIVAETGGVTMAGGGGEAPTGGVVAVAGGGGEAPMGGVAGSAGTVVTPVGGSAGSAGALMGGSETVAGAAGMEGSAGAIVIPPLGGSGGTAGEGGAGGVAGAAGTPGEGGAGGAAAVDECASICAGDTCAVDELVCLSGGVGLYDGSTLPSCMVPGERQAASDFGIISWCSADSCDDDTDGCLLSAELGTTSWSIDTTTGDVEAESEVTSMGGTISMTVPWNDGTFFDCWFEVITPPASVTATGTLTESGGVLLPAFDEAVVDASTLEIDVIDPPGGGNPEGRCNNVTQNAELYFTDPLTAAALAALNAQAASLQCLDCVDAASCEGGVACSSL